MSDFRVEFNVIGNMDGKVYHSHKIQCGQRKALTLSSLIAKEYIKIVEKDLKDIKKKPKKGKHGV